MSDGSFFFLGYVDTVPFRNAIFRGIIATETGADPVVLLTAALNLALVGGFGGILPREILKSRTSEMRFPAF
jgi:hypothetical protein